jgi:hypothetical protein
MVIPIQNLPKNQGAQNHKQAKRYLRRMAKPVGTRQTLAHVALRSLSSGL